MNEARSSGEQSAVFNLLQRLGRGLGRRQEGFYTPIRELGLEVHVAELHRQGFTVVPPGRIGSPERIEGLRAALLRVMERRTGVHHAVEGNVDGVPADKVMMGTTGQYLLPYLLFEDRLFEDWLDHPVLVALVEHTMRGTAQLSSMVSFVKWKGGSYGDGLGLHSDAPASPEGLLSSTHDQVCNAALVLTDYTRENGALAVVPGSHLLCRQPGPGEGIKDAIPVEAPAGSLIFWRGNLWHGAYPKLSDGLRLNLTTYFCHRSLKTQERYQRAVPAEVLARHDARFGRWMGADDYHGWDERGPVT